MVGGVKQLFDEAGKSLPIFTHMGWLASCTSSSCVELAKKISEFCRVEASRGVTESVVRED